MRLRSVTLLAIALASAAGHFACGGAPQSSSYISIYPASADVDLGQQVRFDAAAPAGIGSPSWSVVEPGGGVIDSSGAYTAPAAEGTFHVVAKFGRIGSATQAQVRVRRGIRVAVTPSTGSITTGASIAFTATVTGTSNTGVSWSVAEGPAGGTVSAGGVYVAPGTAGTYHVVATSMANASRSGFATVTVTAPQPPAVVAVAVSPTSASVAASGTQQFTATVTGSTDTSVSWSVQEGVPGGSVSSTGLYTAPATAGAYHVVATSVADPTKSAVATATVTTAPPPAVVAVAVSPTSASVAASGTQQFTATVTGSTNTAVSWSVQEGAAGGSVSSTGLYAAPATAGTYHVIATSSADGTKSAAAAVTVTAPPPTGTTPPDSGTVAWAPAAGDTSFVNVTDYGAVGDAVHDDTTAFSNAAATGKQLFVPRPAVAYKVTGHIPLKSSIYGDGSMPEIRMYGANGDEAHAMIWISGYSGSSPLVVQGLTLNGQWNGGTNGEWSSNVDVINSTNVLVQYNTLENPYGDNVEIGDAAPPGIVRNITVRKNSMYNPMRCNVSLEWADGAVVDSNFFNKNNSYVDSVDAEPNSGTTQYVSNFQLTNNVYDAVPTRSVSLVNGSGVTGTNILVSGNSGHVGSTFIANGSWTNVTVTNNSWVIGP